MEGLETACVVGGIELAEAGLHLGCDHGRNAGSPGREVSSVAVEIATGKEYVTRCTVRVVPKLRLDVVKDDPDDNRIVECAVHSRSEAIITNDKDLLRMKSYHGIRMMKINEFLRQRGLSR